VAPRDGYVAAMDTADLGWASVKLGAGRLVKSDVIDHAVGFILPLKIGDHVNAGQVIGTIHANDPAKLQETREDILAAITFADSPVEPLPDFYGVVS
jgi:pyrimidine-nucleoside phosphorylase